MNRYHKLFILIALFLTLVIIVLGNKSMTTFSPELSEEKINSSPNFNQNDGKFINPVETFKPGFDFSLMWDFFTKDAKISEPKIDIPVIKISSSDFPKRPHDSLHVVWLGHSTSIVDLAGVRILLDPVFSERCSPVSWAGPKRFHPSPIEIEELPEIDIVMISHDHYDHLDYETIQKLKSKEIQFLVPLGIGKIIFDWGVPKEFITEFDWGDSLIRGGVEIISTPARHFSGRGLFDSDESLWSSWVIKSEYGSFFYSGDSGYFEGFKKIGEEHGPFLMSMVGIGASDQRWLEIHTTPEEAVQTHLDVEADKFFPVHWCSFDLGFHTWADPAVRALKSSREHNVDIIMPKLGEIFNMNYKQEEPFWWQKDSTEHLFSTADNSKHL